MSTKEEVLNYIKTLGEQNIITKDELLSAFGANKKTSEAPFQNKATIIEVLYYIGGAIVFLGIAILIAQQWRDLGFAGRVISTLGIGIATYVSACFLIQKEKTQGIAAAFYLISALVIPMGLYVVFDEMGFDLSRHGMQSVISAILFIVFLSSYFLFKKNVLTLFSIIFGTWFFYAITNYLAAGNPLMYQYKFFEYRTLAVGLSYILMGLSFVKTKEYPLTGPLYGFGIMGFLGAAFFLGGFKPSQNVFWEMIYPVLIFGTLFASISLKSKAFLTFGTLYLMFFIFKITGEYFANSIGWPISLMFAGFAIIATGYMAVTLKKKYL